MPGAVTIRDPEEAAFDYDAAAELFLGNRGSRLGNKVGYRRFPRASAAVLFAVETLSTDALNRTFLEVNEERFSGAGIRSLYEHASFPLARKSAR